MYEGPGNGEITPDYPGGSSVIQRSLKVVEEAEERFRERWDYRRVRDAM